MPLEPELPVAVELPVLAAPVVDPAVVLFAPLDPPTELVALVVPLVPTEADAPELPAVLPPEDDFPLDFPEVPLVAADLPLELFPVLEDLPEVAAEDLPLVPLVAADLPLELLPVLPALPVELEELLVAADLPVLFPLEPFPVVAPVAMLPVELPEEMAPELVLPLVTRPDDPPLPLAVPLEERVLPAVELETLPAVVARAELTVATEPFVAVALARLPATAPEFVDLLADVAFPLHPTAPRETAIAMASENSECLTASLRNSIGTRIKSLLHLADDREFGA